MAIKKIIDGYTRLWKAVMCASHHHIHIFTKEKDLAKYFARRGRVVDSISPQCLSESCIGKPYGLGSWIPRQRRPRKNIASHVSWRQWRRAGSCYCWWWEVRPNSIFWQTFWVDIANKTVGSRQPVAKGTWENWHLKVLWTPFKTIRQHLSSGPRGPL